MRQNHDGGEDMPEKSYLPTVARKQKGEEGAKRKTDSLETHV